jgi:hypothetical protein
VAEYVHLIGSEQVGNASRTMVEAADRMQSAANSIHETLFHHQRFLTEWIERFEQAVEKLAECAK